MGTPADLHIDLANGTALLRKAGNTMEMADTVQQIDIRLVPAEAGSCRRALDR
jgi:hypothetical protein